MPRIRTTLVACGLALLVLAGCSSGDDGDDASATTVPTTSQSTTTRPVDTSFTGQDSAEFCALARTYNERFTSVGSDPTPAQLRTVAREGETAITEAVNAAPVEIKGDVEVLADTFGALLDELERVNFNARSLPPEALAPLNEPEFQQSTARFQAYVQNVCGVSGG